MPRFSSSTSLLSDSTYFGPKAIVENSKDEKETKRETEDLKKNEVFQLLRPFGLHIHTTTLQREGINDVETLLDLSQEEVNLLNLDSNIEGKQIKAFSLPCSLSYFGNHFVT